MPSALVLVLYRGTHYRLRFTLVERFDADGAAIDISAWSTQFTLRTSPSATEPALEKAGSVDDVDLCRFMVDLPADDMTDLEAGEYYGSFVRTNTGAEDPLAVPGDPTRPNVSVRHNIYNAP